MALVLVVGSSLFFSHSALNRHLRLRAALLEFFVILRSSLFKRLKFWDKHAQLRFHLRNRCREVLDHVINGKRRRRGEATRILLALSLFHHLSEFSTSSLFLLEKLLDLTRKLIDFLLFLIAHRIEVSPSLLFCRFFLRDGVSSLFATHLFLRAQELFLCFKLSSKLIKDVREFVSEAIPTSVFLGNEIFVNSFLVLNFLVDRFASSVFLGTAHSFIANHFLEFFSHL